MRASKLLVLAVVFTSCGGGGSEPHLHFVVAAPPGSGGAGSLPVTFSNTDPHPNGLVSGRSYPAH